MSIFKLKREKYNFCGLHSSLMPQMPFILAMWWFIALSGIQTGALRCSFTSNPRALFNVTRNLKKCATPRNSDHWLAVVVVVVVIVVVTAVVAVVIVVVVVLSPDVCVSSGDECQCHAARLWRIILPNFSNVLIFMFETLLKLNPRCQNPISFAQLVRLRLDQPLLARDAHQFKTPRYASTFSCYANNLAFILATHSKLVNRVLVVYFLIARACSKDQTLLNTFSANLNEHENETIIFQPPLLQNSFHFHLSKINARLAWVNLDGYLSG